MSDEKLRQIVRETLRELGTEANPELVRKVVREVVRQLEGNTAPTRHGPNRKLPIIDSTLTTTPIVNKKLVSSSSQSY